MQLISIAFVHSWGPKVGKLPLINLSNACGGEFVFFFFSYKLVETDRDSGTFNGTDLLHCPSIRYCIVHPVYNTTVIFANLLAVKKSPHASGTMGRKFLYH